MKFLIALLTAATGVLHLLVGFGVLGGGATTNWLLVLNGAGYLILLVLFWMASGNGGAIRWILLAYALITLIGYFVINMGNNFGLDNTIALIIKAIELLLILLLLFYRGPERVTTTTTARPVTSGQPGWDSTRAGQTSVDTTVSTMASTTSAGVTTAAGAAAAAAMTEFDQTVDATADDVGDAVEEAADWTGDVVDETGDAMRGGAVALGAAAGLAADDDQDVLATDAADLDAAQVAAEPTVEDIRTELEEYLKSFGSSSEFAKDIEYIEGIGAAYGQKLRGAGINTVTDLIVNGATRTGRKHISDLTGVAQSLILTWVNHVDLFRIKGVAQEYADLLEQSGVDTVVELAQRNPANLHKRMLEINEQKALVRRAPHASEVQSWVEQAKSLRRLIYY